MVARAAGLLLVLGTLAATAGAQVPAAQVPPRDAVAAPGTGTATLRGRVVDAQTGRALRRVRISLHAPSLGRDGIPTSTDSDGRYELTDLPAGRFTLEARRSGYLRLGYGQRRPLEPPRPLTLDAGQVLDGVDFALPPVGVISGRIADELGEPIAGVIVSAQRYFYRDNRRRLLAYGPIVLTDDEGDYRITGLVEGTYVVNARTLEKWTVEGRGGREETMGYAPTFFPGVADAGAAARVPLAMGQYLTSVDFALVPGRAATISGVAVDSRGEPLDAVRMSHEVLGLDGRMMGSAGSSSVGPDGRFEVRGVAPGEYTLEAGGAGEFALLPIVVDGVDVANLRLSTSTGWSISGRVVFESRTDARPRRNQVSIAPAPVTGLDRGDPREQRNDDWTFEVTGVIGAARLRVNVPEGWAVRAIRQGTADLADATLDSPPGGALADVEVVLTDRVATVTGPVVDRAGDTARDATVLLFPADASRWYEGSRVVRAERPDQRGEYRITGVIPGEYLAIALDDVELGIWNDPEYLASIRRDARPIVVEDAATIPLPLTMVAP